MVNAALRDDVLGKTLQVCITFTFCYGLDVYSGPTAQMSFYGGNDDIFFHSPQVSERKHM